MSHTAELIAVGTELLLGNIANTDAQMISQGLSELGINVFYHTVVGDNPYRVRQAVDIAKKRADILITTGGLGPTCDDLTKVALAQAFGRKLLYHEPSAQRIRDRFAAMGRPVTENNYQQAMIPEGATVLDNDWGTAPGVRLCSRRGPRDHAPRPAERVRDDVPTSGGALSPGPVRRGHRLPHRQDLRHRRVRRWSPSCGT